MEEKVEIDSNIPNEKHDNKLIGHILVRYLPLGVHSHKVYKNYRNHYLSAIASKIGWYTLLKEISKEINKPQNLFSIEHSLYYVVEPYNVHTHLHDAQNKTG